MRAGTVLLIAAVVTGSAARSQSLPPTGQLDPTRSIQRPQLFSSVANPLPEQYIWTRGQEHGDQRAVPHYFRVKFQVASVPAAATLYLAGATTARVYLNGQPAVQFEMSPLSRLKEQVFAADVAHLLHPGANVLAIEAMHVRTRTPQQGPMLVVKILPAAPGVLAEPLLISGPEWKAATQASDGWQTAQFDDSSWQPVDARGSIEGNIDFLQWNDDAGMYDWPGYQGESPFLAHIFLPAEKLLDVYPAQGAYENLDALTSSGPGGEFSAKTGTPAAGETAPGITLDFGREVAGRVQLQSDSDQPVTVSVAYGESEGELNNEPYLGVDPLTIPPHGTGVGPKSAFRYARIRFLSGAPTVKFRAIRLEDIYYPVQYQGSFESSDPLLNRIWETGVYTTHLCMQNDIWDAPKRDRGRWMGDTDVSGRVSDDVFADHFLLQDTLNRLIGPLPLTSHVNGIPGYSSFWVTELAHYYRHTGQKQYVASMHDRLVALLQFMDKDFDAQNHYINHTNEWLFVDWALGLNGDTSQARAATVLEYVRAYRDGAWLLRQMGDTQNADHFAQRADAIAKTAQAADFRDGSFGPRWQTNAMAVLSGVATPGQYGSIWQNVLAHVGEPTYRPDLITPYYGAYVLDAMAEMNHREAALQWIREYWGGMIAEGATSFWEAYDPAWPKRDPHVDLQADDTTGYQTSLAHGWSSAPSFWLMEQVLGIQPTAPGFAKTTIRPDLTDLEWARGAQPTPHGLLKVDLKKAPALTASIDLPSGVEATVLFPVSGGADHVMVNGAAKPGAPAENGTRLAVTLNQPGHYEIRPR
jgi:alpha-L-rhamnosidase